MFYHKLSPVAVKELAGMFRTIPVEELIAQEVIDTMGKNAVIGHRGIVHVDAPCKHGFHTDAGELQCTGKCGCPCHGKVKGKGN